MNKHTFRWDSLVFGLFFAAVVANWAVWRQDLLTARELSLAGAGVLIVLGGIGIAATLLHSRPTRTTEPKGTTHDEATDPQL
jgi:hypothetical protein